MTLDDLIDEYREEAGDSGDPPFVSDTWLTKRANEGEREVCRRSGLLIESVHAMCTASVTAGDPIVTLHKKIIDIKKARMSSDSQELFPITVSQLSLDWENDTGIPTHYVTDYQSGAIRLYPTPTTSGDLILTVTRLPLDDMSAGTDEPEIREEYHDGLVKWMLHRAYAKQDADCFDPNKSARALAEFEREFGQRKSARSEAWMRERHEINTAPIA